MAAHRIHYPHPLAPGQTVQVTGEEAHHAVRVKRVEVGETIELLDARGSVARTRVAGTRKLPKSSPDGLWALDLTIDAVELRPAPTPRIEVCLAPPKGDRLDQLVDQLSQVGADAWIPLHSDHAVSDPENLRHERLARIAYESMKQCGRAWSLEILPAMSFAEAIAPAPDTAIILADASGSPPATPHAPRVRILIGPEGGFSASELDRARAANIAIARLGPNVLRMETAAALAVGLLRSFPQS